MDCQYFYSGAVQAVIAVVWANACATQGERRHTIAFTGSLVLEVVFTGFASQGSYVAGSQFCQLDESSIAQPLTNSANNFQNPLAQTLGSLLTSERNDLCHNNMVASLRVEISALQGCQVWLHILFDAELLDSIEKALFTTHL